MKRYNSNSVSSSVFYGIKNVSRTLLNFIFLILDTIFLRKSFELLRQFAFQARVTKNGMFVLSLLTLLVSCKEEQKPKVKYDTTAPKVETKKDSSKLEIADLPLQFQSSNVLVYPIGDLRVSDVQKDKLGEYRSSDDKSNFNVSNSMEDEITGYIRNVKFQEVGTDSLHVLTDKVMMIERISFLKSKKVLAYVLADADTNRDNNVDSYDIKSLYLSTDMGKNFTKISPDVQELIDWNYLESTKKIYFRTIEDANKNGAFDKNDKVHYFSLNLTKDWKAEEYLPI